jgi:ketosteroid isomerase-like protein
MSEESATPDLAKRWRQGMEAFVRRDLDAMMSFYAPDAVWDASFVGIGTFEGRAAIRRHFEDWIAPYEEYGIEWEEDQGLGKGVVFAVGRQIGRPHGSATRVQHRPAFVSEWVEGMVVRVTIYLDIDKARAAAERLAGSRG